MIDYLKAEKAIKLGHVFIAKENVILFTLAITTLLAGQYGAIVLCAISIIYTIKDAESGVKALTISFLIFFVNPILFSAPLSPLVSFLRIILLLTFSIKVLIIDVKINRYTSYIRAFIFFVFLTLMITLVSSRHVGLSISKLFQFALVTTAILVFFANTKRTKTYWLSWFLSLFVVLLIASLPFYFIPSVGFARNNFGFQGIVNHPQAFSVFLAPFTALLIGNLLFRNSKNIFLYPLLIFSISSLILTRGRTGIVAIVLGVIGMLAFTVLYKKEQLKQLLLPLKKEYTILVLIVISIICVLNYDFLSEALYSFLLKNEEVGSLDDSFYRSRGNKIDTQISNIMESPFLGIGFGLPSHTYELDIITDPFFNVPISASVEKGVFFISIFEEIGLIGSGSFFLFLFLLIKHVFNYSSVAVQMLLMTALFTNLGEATLFSFGGMGLLVWLIIGVSSIRNDENSILAKKH